ncbi:hypothetical protein IWZ03DRAFT_185569 [Phyllosticta citriasiana]|uniref:Secreted protein n=1 Tax=Phyllosticta citriasiana TaxID=595635 RepID=A0ABR1KRH7_9PEZI
MNSTKSVQLVVPISLWSLFLLESSRTTISSVMVLEHHLGRFVSLSSLPIYLPAPASNSTAGTTVLRYSATATATAKAAAKSQASIHPAIGAKQLAPSSRAA